MSVYSSIQQLRQFIAQYIIGQETLISRLLIALLADGHLLVEGAPGLAKTRAIKVLCQGLEGNFHRIQFTPDLLPADLTGTEVYRPQDGSFRFQQGPLFHNLILADEINRAPAKVQSALLEAMAERQITVGRQTYHLPKLFLVMATQNPIEQEGTYPLPEAQLDRFLMHVRVGYPESTQERSILHLARAEAYNGSADAIPAPQASAVTPVNPLPNASPALVPAQPAAQVLSQELLWRARREVLEMHMEQSLEEYLVQLVLATRQPDAYGKELGDWIQYGCSPRATIMMDRCARAHAWLQNRDYVAPEDIQAIACEVMRHRLILNYEAEAEGIDPDHVIRELLKHVAIP